MLYRFDWHSLCSLPQPSLWYHSSAVLALALDALTLPYRLRNNSVPMWQLADTLAVSGRKVTALFGLNHISVVEGQSSWWRVPSKFPGGCRLWCCSPSHDARRFSPWRSECLRGRTAVETSVSLLWRWRRSLLRPVGDTEGLWGSETNQVRIYE